MNYLKVWKERLPNTVSFLFFIGVWVSLSFWLQQWLSPPVQPMQLFFHFSCLDLSPHSFHFYALTLFYRLIELFYARQEQANVSVASVREICAMIKLCAVSTLSSALNMGARPDELDESGAHVMCLTWAAARN